MKNKNHKKNKMNTKKIGNENNSSFSINVFGKLKDKKSNTIMTTLYKYINEEIPEMIKDKYIESMEQISINIQDLILKKTHEFAKLWNVQFTGNKYAFVEITEAFENLICKSLYGVIMSLENNEKCERNDKLLNKYSFLTLKHLQVDFIIDEFDLGNKLKSRKLKLLFFEIFFINCL